MTHLDYLLRILLAEREEYAHIAIPIEKEEKRRLMRSLLNVRPPLPVSETFLEKQDAELAMQLAEKGVVALEEIPPIASNKQLALWQGDITRLKADAIVNAANSQLLGCFAPMHGCIDNAIHSAAGLQLRQECSRLMLQQGYAEQTGSAKITKGYNLPAKYVVHTVGPIIGHRELTLKDERELADCYRSSLAIANGYKLQSIAFCCISTGEFRFPNQRAAEIAVATVVGYLQNHPHGSIKTVVFNVFKEIDFSIYHKLLQ